MPTSFRVKAFQGLQDGFEDPVDFVEDIETAVERDYARETAALNVAKRQGKPEEVEAYNVQEAAL